MSKHDALIDALAGDLKPVKPFANANLMGMGWLICGALYTVAVTHLLGPIRPNALTQLVSEPRFMAETLLGLLAITGFSLTAFRGGIPGELNSRLTSTATVLLMLWLLSYITGLFYPALEPSMLGKRDHCVVETFIYALPPMGAACYLLRKMYPLRPLQTAVAFSIAAGMLPALYMQIACMYAPDHILKFHILPGLAIVPLGILLSSRLEKTRAQKT